MNADGENTTNQQHKEDSNLHICFLRENETFQFIS